MNFEVPTELLPSVLSSLTSFFSDPGMKSFVTLIIAVMFLLMIVNYFFPQKESVTADYDDEE